MVTGNISDIIATASLLLAVITALMGFWYPDVANARDAKEPHLPAERLALGKRLAPIFWAKALPLALSSTAIAIIFLPRAFSIVWEALSLIGGDWYYDDLKAAFILTESLIGLIAVVTMSLAIQLNKKCRKLR